MVWFLRYDKKGVASTMAKQIWKPGNMVYPVPAVMVTVADKKGKVNIITVAWTGTICTNPPMAYISVKPERYSYSMLEKTKEFVINLTTKDLAFATDFCGVKSGREVDKFHTLCLTQGEPVKVEIPVIKESPVNIECRVTEQKELGSHTMFLAEVVAVQAEKAYFDKSGRFDFAMADPIVYSHGEYFCLGEKLGKFGYSVKKESVEKVKKSKKEEERLRMQLFPKEEHAYKKSSAVKKERRTGQI